MFYKTFYVNANDVDEVLNGFSLLGWSLKNKCYARNLNRELWLGIVDKKERMCEIIIEIDDKAPDYIKRKELTNRYILAIDEELKIKKRSVGGFVTGLVFSILGTITGLVFIKYSFGIAMLVLMIPGIFLNIYGIIHRKRHVKKDSIRVENELKDIRQKALLLDK